MKSLLIRTGNSFGRKREFLFAYERISHGDQRRLSCRDGGLAFLTTLRPEGHLPCPQCAPFVPLAAIVGNGKESPILLKNSLGAPIRESFSTELVRICRSIYPSVTSGVGSKADIGRVRRDVRFSP